MRYSILGFNQEKLLQYNLSMNEVLLLNYIYEAQASPTMLHIIKDEKSYTWLNHDKIQEDLPILNISKDRLKRLIKNLIDAKLIISKQIFNDNLNGSKAYYGITESCEDLRYYIQDRGVENNTSRGVENNTPNNILNNNKNNKVLSKDNTTNFLGSIEKQTKTKKPNLYDKCVNLINEFTDDIVLQDYLIEFLKICLENARESGKPFYVNTFKGKLNTLSKLSEDNYKQREIVLHTLEKGWCNFYEIKEYNNKTKNAVKDIEQLDDKYIMKQGDKNKLRRAIEDGTTEQF